MSVEKLDDKYQYMIIWLNWINNAINRYLFKPAVKSTDVPRITSFWSLDAAKYLIILDGKQAGRNLVCVLNTGSTVSSSLSCICSIISVWMEYLIDVDLMWGKTASGEKMSLLRQLGKNRRWDKRPLFKFYSCWNDFQRWIYIWRKSI